MKNPPPFIRHTSHACALAAGLPLYGFGCNIRPAVTLGRKESRAMLTRTLLSFTLLLTLSPWCRAQSDAQAAGDAAALRRESLLADLRALEAESRELLKPLDAASARAEIAAAAWALDREWAESLLREALALTFPAEVDRAREREHEVGAELKFGPAENGARGRLRRRRLEGAPRDRDLAREPS